MASAVVFAYHDVGVRCLSVLLAHGIEVAKVVTHRDDPKENIWFGSVEKLARENGIEVAYDDGGVFSTDFIFSFYFRHMLTPAVLGFAARGAYNMHGSLLPKYRGRVPVNWAIIKGERETGATLHEMVEKPDAGGIVDQMAVPILPDDLAIDVFRKVTVAAEMVLHRSLPSILDGSVAPRVQDLSKGSYFGARKPEDGRIDWTKTAREVHDLVRAVAPPYPGAFCDVGRRRLRVYRTRRLPAIKGMPAGTPGIEETNDDRLIAHCGDGNRLALLEWEWT
jgi:methionyl-tRNA formyltransferase